MTEKVFIRATVPRELVRVWLQHVRDFDSRHPDCHFEIMIDTAEDVTLAEMVEQMKVNPGLTFTEVFERKK